MAKNAFASLPRSVRIDEELYDHLKLMAEREHRTISNMIEVIIYQAVERDRSNQRFIEESGQ